jgi:hypothetical protein
MIVATYPKPTPEHSVVCRCEECQKYRAGLRTICEHCKGQFKHDEVIYRQGDCGYTPLCTECAKLPIFLPWADRLRLGLLSDDEIANWNAFHAM